MILLLYKWLSLATEVGAFWTALLIPFFAGLQRSEACCKLTGLAAGTPCVCLFGVRSFLLLLL